MTDTTMQPNGSGDETRRTFVPIDGSDLSMNALKQTCTNHPETAITVFHVLESTTADVYGSLTGRQSGDFDDKKRQRRSEVEELFDRATALADEHGVSISTGILTGSIANAILIYAEENDADQIISGQSGRSSIERTLLGSITGSVSDDAEISVTIVK